jgi:hypothetical protein
LPTSIDSVVLAFREETLLTAQTAPAQNGLYTMGESGTQLVAGAYDASGFKDITGLNVTLSYYWVKGNGINAIGATTITATGTLVPDGTGKIRITGTPLATCTASLKLVLLSRDPTLDVSSEFQNGILVRVTSTANKDVAVHGRFNPILERPLCRGPRFRLHRVRESCLP